MCTTRPVQVGYLGGRSGIGEYMGAGPFRFRVHTRCMGRVASRVPGGGWGLAMLQAIHSLLLMPPP